METRYKQLKEYQWNELAFYYWVKKAVNGTRWEDIKRIIPVYLDSRIVDTSRSR